MKSLFPLAAPFLKQFYSSIVSNIIFIFSGADIRLFLTSVLHCIIYNNLSINLLYFTVSRNFFMSMLATYSITLNILMNCLLYPLFYYLCYLRCLHILIFFIIYRFKEMYLNFYRTDCIRIKWLERID